MLTRPFFSQLASIAGGLSVSLPNVHSFSVQVILPQRAVPGSASTYLTGSPNVLATDSFDPCLSLRSAINYVLTDCATILKQTFAREITADQNIFRPLGVYINKLYGICIEYIQSHVQVSRN